MIDSLVFVHVFFNQQSHMHNHYQPLRSKDGDTNVLSDSFLARYGKVHRPATRSLFDVLLPLCDAGYCAVPTQIEQDGDNATPMRRESPFLHDVARLDEKLMNSPIIRSFLPTCSPSNELVEQLCKQICSSNESLIKDAIVMTANDSRSTSIKQNNCAILCPVDSYWLVVRINSIKKSIEWCSSRQQNGAKTRSNRLLNNSRVDGVDQADIEQTIVTDRLSHTSIDTSAGWSLKKIPAPIAIEMSNVDVDSDLSLWALIVLWHWSFAKDNQRFRIARGMSLRMTMNGSTRLGCAIALTYPHLARLCSTRAPPMIVSMIGSKKRNPRLPLHPSEYYWIDNWHSMVEELAKQNDIDKEELIEEN